MSAEEKSTPLAVDAGVRRSQRLARVWRGAASASAAVSPSYAHLAKQSSDSGWSFGSVSGGSGVYGRRLYRGRRGRARAVVRWLALITLILAVSVGLAAVCSRVAQWMGSPSEEIDGQGDAMGELASPLPQTFESTNNSTARIPLELLVMARCPDALLCEAVMERVLSRVGSITDVRLTYIAEPALRQPNGDKEPFGETKCMHGPLECAAARQQLCVARYYDSGDERTAAPLPIWYRFMRCQNRHAKYLGEPWLAELCARQVGVHYGDRVRACADGAEGLALLRDSAKRAHQLGIRTSCTILLNSQLRCVHDQTWKSCPSGSSVQDFVRDICLAYHGPNRPLACNDYPTPA